MKKLIALCLLVCLLGCQSKPKEKEPEEPYVKNTERYRYTFESMPISEELTELLNGNHFIWFYKAYNGKLLLEQRDDTVLDQVGRTKALYEYDLNTQELKNLTLPGDNIKIRDAIYYQDQYIYIVQYKGEHLTKIIAENQNQEKTILFEETGIPSIMGQSAFEIAEDGLYYCFHQELDNQRYTKYQRITPKLEVEPLWEEKNDSGKVITLIKLSKNAALMMKDGTYIYLKDGKELVINSESDRKFTCLLSDYLIFDEAQYFDLATKEWKSLADTTLPNLSKSSYIDNNTVLYVDDSKEVHASYFVDGSIEDEKIGEITGGSGLNYYWINDQGILAIHSYTKGTDNILAFYLIHREAIEQ
ncbi:hypothetical protein [Beduini massiliensis]|uniref:hypothetical protein n=1 Tax=Beduini massiliensis TaxID=1585974 RepID=UPI00059AA463|nr:hypothetical protein [Beduini massiliensis]